MLDAWSCAISRLTSPVAPVIAWPDDRRWLALGGMPAQRPRAVAEPKLVKHEARRPRADVTDDAVLTALQAAGATNALSLSLALAVSRSTLWRRLRGLEDAGRVRCVAGRWRVE